MSKGQFISLKKNKPRHSRSAEDMLLNMTGGGDGYYSRLKSLYSSNLVIHYPMGDKSGVTCEDVIGSADGTHNNTAGALNGITLLQPGFLGQKATHYDGTSGYTIISSTALKNLIDTQEFTIMGITWPTNVAVWTSGDTYSDFLCIRADASNYIEIGKYGLANKIQFSAKMGGTQKIELITGVSFTSPFHWAYTVSATGDLIKCYINGSPISVGLGGLGTWAAGTTKAYISAGSIEPITSRWNGYLQHLSFIDRPLTAPEVAALTSGFF